MNLHRPLFLLLTLLAAGVGCGTEPTAVDSPAPVSNTVPAASKTAAVPPSDGVSDNPTDDIRPHLDDMSETNDPFLASELSTDESVDDIANTSFDETDDAVAADKPDIEDLALIEDGETEEGLENDETKPRYTTRKIHDPNGIGKFYMGREIAHVMGYQGAAWLERSEREEEERLSLLMKALDLQPGQVVADIGAGSGVITLLMAELVGPEGEIIAVDVQQKMLDLLKKKLRKFDIKNVKLVKGTNKSPKLDPASIDLAIMVDVYHEFEFPYEMMLELSNALKPGGAIAFVEYRMEDPTVPIKLVHKMSVEQVKLEAEQPEFGLQYRETIDILPRQHIIVFEKQQESNEERESE